MPRRKREWKFVPGCEHCGEFQIPAWGYSDGFTTWCADCGHASGLKNIPNPPIEIEQARQQVYTALDNLLKMIGERGCH